MNWIESTRQKVGKASDLELLQDFWPDEVKDDAV
jgi:hypothetical protein